MKNQTKVFTRLNVLKSEEKLDRDTGRQSLDRDNNPLYTISVLEETPNEEFGIMQQNVVKYKSLLPLELGDNLVEVKMSSMGEGSGNFIKINNYYTILRKLSSKETIDSLFDPVSSIVATKQPKKAEARVQ